MRPGAVQWLRMRIRRRVYLFVLQLRYTLAVAEVEAITSSLAQDREDLRLALLTQRTLASEMQAVGLLRQPQPNEANHAQR